MDTFSPHKWFRNQYLNENDNHVMTPDEFIKKELPFIHSWDDIQYTDLLSAMGQYAKYISDWEINNYRNSQR